MRNILIFVLVCCLNTFTALPASESSNKRVDENVFHLSTKMVTLTRYLRDYGVGITEGDLMVNILVMKSVGIPEDLYLKALILFETRRKKDSYLQKFRRGNTSDSFYEFLESLKQLNLTKRKEVLANIFGKKYVDIFLEASREDLYSRIVDILDKSNLNIDDVTRYIKRAAILKQEQELEDASRQLQVFTNTLGNPNEMR